jgi:hypothetical protein
MKLLKICFRKVFAKAHFPLEDVLRQNCGRTEHVRQQQFSITLCYREFVTCNIFLQSIEAKQNLNEICGLLGYYAALSGSSVPTFRDNISVPSSRVKKSKNKSRKDLGIYSSI